jgi:two-component system, OmpR family, phosphate regulon response regulator PhoB
MFRVLVVEDDRDINETVQAGLKIAGYDAVGVLTGSEALREIGAHCPDLVLLDQMLPDIDGFEVCRRIRQMPRTKRVPVAFVTASSSEHARVKGLAMGADDYIVKPFSMPELVLRVGAILRRATPTELKLPPEWLQLRDQFRVWNGYAEIHFSRGEWRDCFDLSRRILQTCQGALSTDERARIYERLAQCADRLGDPDGRRDWLDRARADLDSTGVAESTDR